MNLQLNQADGSVPAQPGKGLLPGSHPHSNLRQLFLNSLFPPLPCTNVDSKLLLAPTTNAGLPAVPSAIGRGEMCGCGGVWGVMGWGGIRVIFEEGRGHHFFLWTCATEMSVILIGAWRLMNTYLSRWVWFVVSGCGQWWVMIEIEIVGEAFKVGWGEGGAHEWAMVGWLSEREINDFQHANFNYGGEKGEKKSQSQPKTSSISQHALQWNPSISMRIPLKWWHLL